MRGIKRRDWGREGDRGKKDCVVKKKKWLCDKRVFRGRGKEKGLEKGGGGGGGGGGVNKI